MNINTTNMKELLHQTYGSIFEEALLNEIEQVALLKEFNDGDVIIDFGDKILKMPLLLSGAIKILREDFGEPESQEMSQQFAYPQSHRSTYMGTG